MPNTSPTAEKWIDRIFREAAEKHEADVNTVLWCPDRPSPPVEPKCAECGKLEKQHTPVDDNDLDVCYTYRPPATTGPAESEGECLECALSSGVRCSVHMPPAAPAIDSVEDAKAYLRTIDDFSGDFHDLAAPLMEDYAAKHLESERAEIERKAVENAFADVKKLFHPIEDDEEWDDSVCICFHCEAMQAVKQETTEN